MTSNVDQWIEALERIRKLDADHVVPGHGHGPVQTIKYVDRQRAVLLAWKAAVAVAVASGWTRDETIARVRFDDAFGPLDVGQGYMMDHIQNGNTGSLWDELTATAAWMPTLERGRVRRR